MFWGNHQDVKKVFILQKRILRWMLGLGYRSSCRAWLKQFEILTVPSLFTYSLAMFAICSSSCFQTSFSVHYIHTRQKNHLPNKWLNLHPNKGALLILPLRYAINCHWTLRNFNMTKCSSRLHWKSIYLRMFLICWWIFSILVMLVYPAPNQFLYNVVFLILSIVVYIFLILTCFIFTGCLTDIESTKWICTNVNVTDWHVAQPSSFRCYSITILRVSSLSFAAITL
jgi:hypothetical protein